MTDGTFLSRAWPSLVALVGTIAVVFGLLFFFGGGESNGSGDDSTATEENDLDAGVTPGATTPPDDAAGDPSGEPGEGDDESEGKGGEATEAPPADPVEAPAELRTPVGILNSTDIAGLAGGAQERFIDGGWDVPVVTDYSGEVGGTTAYYPSDDLQASAEALQAQFPEIRFVEPTPSGNLARDRILVILAEDYAEAVGANETG